MINDNSEELVVSSFFREIKEIREIKENAKLPKLLKLFKLSVAANPIAPAPLSNC